MNRRDLLAAIPAGFAISVLPKSEAKELIATNQVEMVHYDYYTEIKKVIVCLFTGGYAEMMVAGERISVRPGDSLALTYSIRLAGPKDLRLKVGAE